MRAYTYLDTNAMPWEATDTPGLYTKALSHDPENGARTAFQCIDPKRGYKPPETAHYHHMDEELLVIKGTFTFDGKNWLGPKSYCFHPAQTVHGFRSRIDDEAWFISRCSKELDFCLYPEATGDTPYSLTDTTDPRGVTVLADPEAGAWVDVVDDSGAVTLQRQVLSKHPETGEGSMLVRFLPGWESPNGDHFHTVYEELFVLDGAMETDDGDAYGTGTYLFKPPLTVQSRPKSKAGALAYISFGGPLDFVPAARLSEFAN
jgi:quercetin dioxygenase-like cupin family protein